MISNQKDKTYEYNKYPVICRDSKAMEDIDEIRDVLSCFKSELFNLQNKLRLSERSGIERTFSEKLPRLLPWTSAASTVVLNLIASILAFVKLSTW